MKEQNLLQPVVGVLSAKLVTTELLYEEPGLLDLYSKNLETPVQYFKLLIVCRHLLFVSSLLSQV